MFDTWRLARVFRPRLAQSLIPLQSFPFGTVLRSPLGDSPHVDRIWSASPRASTLVDAVSQIPSGPHCPHFHCRTVPMWSQLGDSPHVRSILPVRHRSPVPTGGQSPCSVLWMRRAKLPPVPTVPSSTRGQLHWGTVPMFGHVRSGPCSVAKGEP